jgi:APA family basic amino acid/polyamine antiporter
MAADGLLPRAIAAAGDTPHAAVLLQIGLAVLVVWIAELRELLGYIGFTLGLSAAAAVGGLLVLRRRLGGERVPVPGHPWLQLAYIGATVVISCFLVVREPMQAAWGALTVASGLPVYAWMRRRR